MMLSRTVLLWEQIVIFGAALILGALLGLLTAQLALPSLLLTSTLPSGNVTNGLDLFSIQDTPPAHMVVAPALGLALSSLLLLGIVTLGLMYRSTTRVLLAQTLRVNPD